MKRPKPDIKAIMARLEKNKEKSRKKDSATIHEHPIMKVDGPGVVDFRAAIYPHSDNPAAEPFVMRYHHFGIDGTGIVWCPQKNAGEQCDLCDFIWEQMKSAKGNTGQVKKWAKKLPKARIWIAGKIRGREEEGPKFLTFGTQEDRMSESHEKLLRWFSDEDTQDWMDPEKGDAGGFDVQVKYEEYDAAKSAALNGAKFGFASIDLARKSTDFGGDYDAFLKSIPNIDDNDIDILKSYSRRSTQDTREALEKWLERLEKKSGAVKTVKSREVDSDDSDMDDGDDDTTDVSESQSRIAKRLEALGLG